MVSFSAFSRLLTHLFLLLLLLSDQSWRGKSDIRTLDPSYDTVFLRGRISRFFTSIFLIKNLVQLTCRHKITKQQQGPHASIRALFLDATDNCSLDGLTPNKYNFASLINIPFIDEINSSLPWLFPSFSIPVGSLLTPTGKWSWKTSIGHATPPRWGITSRVWRTTSLWSE